MAALKTEELRIAFLEKDKPYIIDHQKSYGEIYANLNKIELDYLEIFNADSIADILFVTNNNIDGIDLTAHRSWATKEGNNMILKIDKLPDFSQLVKQPIDLRWVLLRSSYHEQLRGLLRGKLHYFKL